MNTDTCMNTDFVLHIFTSFLSYLDSALVPLSIGTDTDKVFSSNALKALKMLFPVREELRVVEVRVGIDVHVMRVYQNESWVSYLVVD